MHALGNSDRCKRDMNRVVKHYWVGSECIVLCNVVGGGPKSTGCTDLVSIEVVDVTRIPISQPSQEPTARIWGNCSSTCLGPLGKPRDLSWQSGYGVQAMDRLETSCCKCGLHPNHTENESGLLLRVTIGSGLLLTGALVFRANRSYVNMSPQSLSSTTFLYSFICPPVNPVWGGYLPSPVPPHQPRFSQCVCLHLCRIYYPYSPTCAFVCDFHFVWRRVVDQESTVD